ncbi:uncharacterized protein LOC141899895 isoform X1 [Tubulanus polymorphus]|uniref:uncharacterized protein LOC141899895 isoform X1 n=1 Tax=Tubulanus polymorphus TaxID=672921 RepID=UPI003DA3D8FB
MAAVAIIVFILLSLSYGAIDGATFYIDDEILWSVLKSSSVDKNRLKLLFSVTENNFDYPQRFSDVIVYGKYLRFEAVEQTTDLCENNHNRAASPVGTIQATSIAGLCVFLFAMTIFVVAIARALGKKKAPLPPPISDPITNQARNDFYRRFRRSRLGGIVTLGWDDINPPPPYSPFESETPSGEETNQAETPSEGEVATPGEEETATTCDMATELPPGYSTTMTSTRNESLPPYTPHTAITDL